MDYFLCSNPFVLMPWLSLSFWNIGTFPSVLLRLTNLRKLDIANNMFVGSIPIDIKNLALLTHFDATGNDFHGPIGAGIVQLSRLEELILDENLISGELPQTLDYLPKLTTFSVSRKDKSGRKLVGSLPSFSFQSSLEVLDLNGNDLTGSIPHSFLANSGSLRSVDLRNNVLTGSVPATLGKHSSLELLLTGNAITDLPPDLCDKESALLGALGQISSCDAILCRPGTASPFGRTVNETSRCTTCPAGLNTSSFFGSTICKPDIDERDILMNFFDACGGNNWNRRDFWGSSVDVCDWYGIGCNSGQVVAINLAGNNVIGKPPTLLFDLPALQILTLSSNPVEFSFDGTFSARNLLELRLDGTNVSSIDGVSKLESLTVLDASLTSISGSFPVEVFDLPNLRVLSLRNNALTGPIPVTNWRSLKYLRVLRLNNNDFTGPVPSFSDCPVLSHLELSKNHLSGSIPVDLLSGVSDDVDVTIALSDNEISGSIPEEFSRFERLTILLRNNMITNIPRALCSKTEWNRGQVGLFGCDAILCHSGSINQIGRQDSKENPCKRCVASLSYLGRSMCPGGQMAASYSSPKLLSLSVAVALSTLVLLL